MKNIRIFTMLGALAMLLSFNACNSWIDPDYNIDPNNPQDASLANILPPTQVAWGYISGGDLGRYLSVFTQHHGGVDRQHAGLDQYSMNEADVNNSWNTIYADILFELQIVIDKAADPDAPSPHYGGIGKIMTANILQVLTDLYNDIPYSQAFQGFDNLRPGYDSQEQIYNTIFQLLNEGIADCQAATSTLSPGGNDMIYGGDMAKWVGFANSLKARAYVNLGNVNSSNYQSALDAIDDGAIASNADDAVFMFRNTEIEANPLYQFMDQRGDIRMGAFFMDLMDGINDPRIPFFADEDQNAGYSGSPAGVPTVSASPPGTYYASRNSPVVFSSYAETKFIEAEAAFQANNPTRAADAYNEGIEASLEKIVGTADPAFLAAQSKTAGTITLEDIMTHKYIATYTMVTSYTDWRRTGLPNIQPAQGQTQIPRRWPYPQSERLFNGGNVPAGITLFTKVWWDQ